MLRIQSAGRRLCDGITRRDVMHVGGLGMLGLALPDLLRNTGKAETTGSAQSCILLFLLGGPPQHSTWDPKPDAAAEVRGDFAPISTTVPGLQFGELMPRLAGMAEKLCVLRAVSTRDNAHSSSGYYMLTGQPHQPMNRENANPGSPNDWPCLGGVVQRLTKPRGKLPTSIRLPKHIFNTDGSVWPGQDAGFLGDAADPWLLQCEPASKDYQVREFSLPVDVSATRLQGRAQLLDGLNRKLDIVDRSRALDRYDGLTQRAFGLLSANRSRRAFNLAAEPQAIRELYGQSQFGQSTLLARRLVEGGVRLVQVNWFRGPDEPASAPCWDSHVGESKRLKNVLVPPMDQAFSALLTDLSQRGLLDETLVVCMAEFGRTPRMNSRAGRDHWGNVFSIAMAGGGIKGGCVYGASDRLGAEPKDRRVPPEDITATIFHCLGIRPDSLMHDVQGRELTISHGQVIEGILS